MQLSQQNNKLASMHARDRVDWALCNLPGKIVLSSSFGVQSAVCLHLVTQLYPNIPIVLIDTGYLFKETYRFIDELTERLKLNLYVFANSLSPAWQEARYGKLWEQGIKGIERYNALNKVEPMEKALHELGAQTWFAGLRQSQSKSREKLSVLVKQGGRYKMHPIIDWSNDNVLTYLRDNKLPSHPLWDEGYVSIGDTHTTLPLQAGMAEEDTRFFGLKRECGLHLNAC